MNNFNSNQHMLNNNFFIITKKIYISIVKNNNLHIKNNIFHGLDCIIDPSHKIVSLDGLRLIFVYIIKCPFSIFIISVVKRCNFDDFEFFKFYFQFWYYFLASFFHVEKRRYKRHVLGNTFQPKVTWHCVSDLIIYHIYISHSFKE